MGDDRLRGDELAAFERLETLAAGGSGSVGWIEEGDERPRVNEHDVGGHGTVP